MFKKLQSVQTLFLNNFKQLSQSMVVRKGEIEIRIGNIIWF